MTIAAILKHKGHDVTSVGPTATVAEVVNTLAEKRIGAVLVCDANQLRGILSERDVVANLAMHGARTLDMTAGQVMTPAPTTIGPHTTIAEAMSIMTEGRFRHLPVLVRGELVGLVSIGDIVKARIMQQENEVDSLKAYVSGAA